MSEPSKPFGDARLVVLVPAALGNRGTDDARFAKLVPVIEVMVQEGLAAFSLTLEDAPLLPRLAELYEHRATFGVHGIDSTSGIEASQQHTASFVLANTGDPAVVVAGLRAGLAILPSALTPTEIATAHRLGVAAVQVAPAEVMGGQYPDHLAWMVPDVPLVPRGGLGGWTVRRWFEKGALACCLDDGLVGDAFENGNLSDLRDRCRSFTSVVDEIF